MKRDKLRGECANRATPEGAEQTRERGGAGRRGRSERKRKIYRRTAVNFVTAMWVEAGVDLSIAVRLSISRRSLLSSHVFVLCFTFCSIPLDEIETTLSMRCAQHTYVYVRVTRLRRQLFVVCEYMLRKLCDHFISTGL